MGLLKNLETQFIKLAVYLISAYQRTLSPDHGPRRSPTCRFTPTCSEYTKTAIEKFGVLGILLGAWHIIRCNPFMTKVHTHEEVPEVLKIGNFIIRKGNF